MYPISKLRILKSVTLDVSDIMDFFGKRLGNVEKKEGVYFHEDIPFDTHEEFFQTYMETLKNIFQDFNKKSKGCFEVIDASYLSFPKGIQIRYTVIFNRLKEGP